MAETLTYLFCLVRSARRPALPAPAIFAPLGATALQALDGGRGLWLIAATVPARDYGEAALARGLQNLDWVSRRAIAHEAVVEQFLSASAVLPMQLFTLFTNEERAQAHIAADRRRIDRILDRVERQLEWGLRLTFDERAARDAAARGNGRASRGNRPRQPTARSGAEYLARKRDLLDVSRVQLAGARSDANRLYRAMAREATAARRRTEMERQSVPGSRLLLDAAFLVPVKQASKFKAALRRSAKSIAASGLTVSLTGPWPPYNFIDTPRARRRTPTVAGR